MLHFENNLRFLLVDKLVPFLKNMPHKNVTDKVRLGKQKVTNIVRQGLSVYYKTKNCEERMKTSTKSRKVRLTKNGGNIPIVPMMIKQ